jgi:hypothetical protein
MTGALIRRLRGVLVAATIWGVAFWVLDAAFLLGMMIVGGDAAAPTLRLLVDIGPMSVAMGGVAGAAFAVILSVFERKRELTTLSKARVGLWGFAAGLFSAVAIRAALGHGSEPLLAWHNAYFALTLGGTSSYLARAMLGAARRAERVGPEMERARPGPGVV